MRVILVTIIFLISYNTNAQKEWSYKYVDSITYQQYINKDFKQLIKTGKEAFNKEYDFFYLRMRVGIAFYETKNYERAIVHFKKAHQMNPSDQIAQEYYYYSLLLSLHTVEANELAKGFSKELQSKINYKPDENKDLVSSFESLSITSGISFNDNSTMMDNDILQDSNYAENTLYDDTYFANIYFNNRINNRLNIYNNFSYFNVKSMGIVQSIITDDEQKEFTNTNFNYTIGGSYNMKKGLKIEAFYSVLNEKSNYLSAELNATNQTIEFFNNPYQHTANSGGISVSKRYKNFKLILATAIGNLESVNQLQVKTSLLWYPLGNTNLYSRSNFAYLKNNGNNQYIISQTLGGKLSKKISCNLKGSFGNHHNYISNNGIIAYNSIDPILIIGEANLFVKFGKITLIPAYNFQQRENSYIQYTDTETHTTSYSNYNNHLLKLTFLWNL